MRGDLVERKLGSYPDHLAQVCELSALTPPELAAVLERTLGMLCMTPGGV